MLTFHEITKIDIHMECLISLADAEFKYF